MGGFFGVASKNDCVFDLFFGTDYHSHLGTRRAGLAVYSKEDGFNRSIHNIENSPFRTKFSSEINEVPMEIWGCNIDEKATSFENALRQAEIITCLANKII